MPTVYRFFDAEGGLLYVGMTLSYESRLSTHKSASPWWPRVARIELERFDTRREAMRAEFRAILGECPEFNVQGQPAEAGHPFRMMRQGAMLSREELAEAADCGAETIRQYESGRRMPSVGTACRLADALGVSFEDVARCFVPARDYVST